MTTRFWLLGAIAIAVPAQAQRATPAPARWTLGAGLGGAAEGTKLAAGLGWKEGWSAAANLTYRVSNTLGVRGDATFDQNALSGAAVAVPGERRFNKFSYMGNAVLNTPRQGDRVAPYLLAGVGAVTVHDKGSDSTFTRFAGDVGLGVAYRMRRLGLRAEGRSLFYRFDRFGYRKTQNDMVWQAGVALGI